MPLPEKYHAITFMGILVMLLLLGLYLLSGGFTQTVETAAAAAESRTATSLQPPSSSEDGLDGPQSIAYRHPIVYDRLTGATNNQINDVLGAVDKQPSNELVSDHPIDHYQHQRQRFHPAGQNLLAGAQQQQRHRQQMLDRQMLFGPPNAFNPFGMPALSPPPPTEYPPNQTNPTNFYPDPALYRQQQQPMMAPPFPMPPPPPQSQRPHQHQLQSATNQAPQVGPPYAHLNISPMSQYEQQQHSAAAQQQLLKPAAQSRIIPLNSRIDPAANPALLVGSSSGQQQPQTVLAASNQAPSRTSNSFLPPLQAATLSAGSGAGASRLGSAAPVCVRQQIDQQQQQQVPNNDTATARLLMPVVFCNTDPEYPTKEIMRALEVYAQEQQTIEHLMPQLLVQLHFQAQQQPGANHQLLSLDQLQSSLLISGGGGATTTGISNNWQNNSNSPMPEKQQLAEKPFPSANFEQMCRSTIQMVQPKRAKNLAGQWKIVVNLPGHKYRGIAISQMVRVEECSAPLSECATPSKPSIGLAKSSCLQHFENQRLVSWSPQQGLHVDMFRMPVACSCHIRRSSPPSVAV